MITGEPPHWSRPPDWLTLEKLRKAVHLQLPACKETVIIASKVSADLKVLHYFCTELYCTDFSFWYKQVTSQASTALPSPCSPLQQGNTDGQHGLPAAQLGQQLGQAGKEGGHGYSSYITKYPDNLALTEVQMASFSPMKTLIVYTEKVRILESEWFLEPSQGF